MKLKTAGNKYAQIFYQVLKIHRMFKTMLFKGTNEGHEYTIYYSYRVCDLHINVNISKITLNLNIKLCWQVIGIPH